MSRVGPTDLYLRMKKQRHTSKLNIAAETIRMLTSDRLAGLAGGQKPTENWTTTTDTCTHDLFCPSRAPCL